MKNKFVDTKDYTYSTLCDVYQKFSMPHNQRPYAWKTTQLNQLWDSIVENDEGYFIGNLVCLKPSEESENSLVVIDGQQRLTSISIFIIAFRNILLSYEKTNLVNEQLNLLDHYLYWRNPRTQEKISRLIPGKENLIGIYKSLLGQEENIFDCDDNQQRYISNLKYATSIIKKELKNKKPEELDLVIKKVLSIQFIAIVVDSENDIYDLFEGLNSTGLGLSVADLLKNAILKSASLNQGIRINIESNWLRIENLFEDTRISLFPKFLRHYWISRKGYINSSKLFKTIKKEKIERKSGADVDSFTKELLADAEIYIGLKFEEFENYLGLLKKDEKSKKIIKVFRYIGGLDQIYEVLLAFYNKKLNDSEYKLSEFREDLRRLLNFSILAKYVSINPSDYENIFASICESTIEKSGNSYKKDVGGKFKKLYRLVSKKDEFASNFAENLEYGSGSKLIDFIMIELMVNYCNEDRGILLKEPTIEHIVPQEPKKWGLSKESVGIFVNKIGNLTLLHFEDNNDAGNETMDKKVANVYIKSKYKFNRDIRKYEKTFIKNPELAVRKRGEDLGMQTFDLLKIL